MRRFDLIAILLTILTASSISVQAATSEFEQPDAYAVVIGISQYREDAIPMVAYAVKDAQAVALMLERQGGIPKTHIRLLTGSKATGNDLRSVGEWLRMRVKPDSTVYVYYAGHGTPNLKTGEAYLVPWDGHPDYSSGLYPLKDLYASLNALPTRDVIVMLDSCFSGAAGRSVAPKDTRPMIVSMENPLLASGKVMVIAAATGNQVSSDYAKGEHGLFTYFLLAGLKGEADADHDQVITLQELFPYVREHVTNTAVEELNREQTPVFLPGAEMLVARGLIPLTGSISSQKSSEPAVGAGSILSKGGVLMALVPAGEFLYGDNHQRMSLPDFYMDKYEVTTRLYAQFQQALSRKQPDYWNLVSLTNADDRPVIGVNWHDADTYCRWAGKRLPTEQEWEKAARGTDGRKYPWGNETPNRQYANYDKSFSGNFYNDRLTPVGNFETGKSPYGIYDLAGNVWEWTSSDYDSSNKVLRGGSWRSDTHSLVVTHRYWRNPQFRNNDRGFRCAQDASQ